ncbi:hypothetical protein BDR26DRAFT_915254 [Obelidium mucronatum]|nr:hypothetical protein BDR26DRAFT_915254 [Obelidium mucronatum]
MRFSLNSIPAVEQAWKRNFTFIPLMRVAVILCLAGVLVADNSGCYSTSTSSILRSAFQTNGGLDCIAECNSSHAAIRYDSSKKRVDCICIQAFSRQDWHSVPGRCSLTCPDWSDLDCGSLDSSTFSVYEMVTAVEVDPKATIRPSKVPSPTITTKTTSLTTSEGSQKPTSLALTATSTTKNTQMPSETDGQQTPDPATQMTSNPISKESFKTPVLVPANSNDGNLTLDTVPSATNTSTPTSKAIPAAETPSESRKFSILLTRTVAALPTEQSKLNQDLSFNSATPESSSVPQHISSSTRSALIIATTSFVLLVVAFGVMRMKRKRYESSNKEYTTHSKKLSTVSYGRRNSGISVAIESTVVDMDVVTMDAQVSVGCFDYPSPSKLDVQGVPGIHGCLSQCQKERSSIVAARFSDIDKSVRCVCLDSLVGWTKSASWCSNPCPDKPSMYCGIRFFGNSFSVYRIAEATDETDTTTQVTQISTTETLSLSPTFVPFPIHTSTDRASIKTNTPQSTENPSLPPASSPSVIPPMPQTTNKLAEKTSDTIPVSFSTRQPAGTVSSIIQATSTTVTPPIAKDTNSQVKPSSDTAMAFSTEFNEPSTKVSLPTDFNSFYPHTILPNQVPEQHHLEYNGIRVPTVIGLVGGAVIILGIVLALFVQSIRNRRKQYNVGSISPVRRNAICVNNLP